MFTINIYLRFALIVIFLLGGIALAFIYGFWYALPLILIGLILLGGYIALGTVQSSAKLMQTMDFAAAEQRLKMTYKPEWLYKANRAYYYMIKGTLAMQMKDNERAEQLFQKSISTGLPGENEQAMVKLQLSNLAAMKNNWRAAENYFKEAKKLKVTELQIKEQIQQFEKALKNKGALKASRHRHRGAAMRSGGKRRRPRIR